MPPVSRRISRLPVVRLICYDLQAIKDIEAVTYLEDCNQPYYCWSITSFRHSSYCFLQFAIDWSFTFTWEETKGNVRRSFKVKIRQGEAWIMSLFWRFDKKFNRRLSIISLDIVNKTGSQYLCTSSLYFVISSWRWSFSISSLWIASSRLLIWRYSEVKTETENDDKET